MSNQKDIYINGNISIERKDNSLFYFKDEKKNVLPIMALDQIYLLGHAEFNNEVLNLLGENGIMLHCFNFFGNYTGSFMPKNIKTSAPMLLKQVEFYQNNSKRIIIAKKFIISSSYNMIKNLRYKFKFKNKNDYIKKIEEYICKMDYINNINELMGIEANIRKVYYNAIDNELIFNNKHSFCMDKRVIRPPNNKTNSLISFGNSILYATVLNEIYKTPLNPSISYLHSIQRYRYSLSLDIAEIFKPIIVDRIILKLINLKMIQDKHFDTVENACFLNKKGREIFLKEYNDNLMKTVRIKSLNRDVSMKYLMRLEGYKLIKHLTENKTYKPYIIDR